VLLAIADPARSDAGGGGAVEIVLGAEGALAAVSALAAVPAGAVVPAGRRAARRPAGAAARAVGAARALAARTLAARAVRGAPAGAIFGIVATTADARGEGDREHEADAGGNAAKGSLCGRSSRIHGDQSFVTRPEARTLPAEATSLRKKKHPRRQAPEVATAPGRRRTKRPELGLVSARMGGRAQGSSGSPVRGSRPRSSGMLVGWRFELASHSTRHSVMRSVFTWMKTPGSGSSTCSICRTSTSGSSAPGVVLA